MNIVPFKVSIAALVLFLAACSGSTVEDHLVSAEQFIAAAEPDAAIIELKNALQKDKESAQARWLLGKIYLDSGDILSAEKELRRALDLGWPRNDVIPALGTSLLAQAKYTELDQLGMRGMEPKSEARLMASKALAALALGKNSKAKKLVGRALDKDPESADALLAKARILASQGDLDGGETTLTALLDLEPDNSAAWALMGDILRGQQNSDKALEAYNKALTLRPDDFTVQFKRSLLLLQTGDLASAQTDADALMRISPQHRGANYVQGLLHFQAGRYPEAITTLSVAEPMFKSFPLLLFFLASSQLIEGHLDLAAVQAVRFHNIAPGNIQGRKLLATIRLQQGTFEEVEELVGPVLDANPDDVDALNLMANALLRSGNTDEGINMLSRVAELQPGSPMAQVRLGAGLLLDGKGDAAEQYMETALELDPEFQQADILLVMNHMQKNDYDAAIEAAQAYRRRNLTSITPLNLLGRVYQASGQSQKAVETFEKALQLDEGDPSANHNLAQIAAANGDLKKARQYYATILENHENHLASLIQLALLDAKEENGEALQTHLEQAISNHPSAIEPRLLLARFHLSEQRPEKVAALFADLPEAQKKSPKVLELIVLAQLSAKEHKEAQFTLAQLTTATNRPDTAPLHHLKAMAAAGAGDPELTEQELRKAIALDETYIPSRLALAKLARARSHSEEFTSHLEKLVELAPDNTDVLLLRAASTDDAATAIKFAEQAFKGAPSSVTLLALATYKTVAGYGDEAVALYRSWLKKEPKDIAIRLSLATYLQLEERIDETNTELRELLALSPDNVIVLNNLAWNIRNEDPEKALEYIQRASDLAPQSADVWDTRAVVEFANEDYEKARRSVMRALGKSPDNPTMVYHSAMIANALGERTSARKTLEKLLEDEDDFPEIEGARALLLALKK